MHRLVPQFIQEQYAAGRHEGSFEACALFVDISGFTPITDAIMGHGQHGAEVLAGILQDIFDPLVRSVFEYGGFVTNFAGDAFTAVFRSRTNSQDPMMAALAAAWKMQQLVRASAQCKTPYGDFTLSVKVGLSFGEVAWGVLSSTDSKRAAYYFQGLAIDGCANAQKLAEAGQVVVDSAVFEAASSIIRAEPVGDHFRITAIMEELPEPQPIHLDPVHGAIVNHFFPAEASQQGVRGEFRQVVSVFISLPTVQSVEQLRVFMQAIFSLQDRYGGLLNRLDFGDKGANILLFWGAPIAHENDVARALNFIIDLQSQTVVPVGAGITYSIAHGGYSGGELAGEYTCHGRGTTLAARFMQTAQRGEVWLDESTAQGAERSFEVELEGTLLFKGFAEKQKVFILLERKEESEPFAKGKLIGRQAEQEQIASFVQPLWRGQFAGLMVIRGEPGIGKSRLVDAFLGNLQGDVSLDFQVFVCQTDEILRESLNPFRYWLRRYLGQSEHQSNARNKRSFNRMLDQLIATTQEEALAAELDRTRSFLGSLVNLHWSDSLYEQLDAKGRYENTFRGLTTLIQVESLHRPVILVLEDVHWLDNDSDAFLEELVGEFAAGKDYPIAILATARRDGDPDVLGGEIGYQEIALDRISPADQASLAESRLGSPAGSDLLELLVERAEGNPFFTEQILEYLQEQELLGQVDGEWHLKTLRQTLLPTDVRVVLVARLDRLRQEVRDVVQTASILGREFELMLLSRMLDDDPDLNEKVTAAESMAIWTALSALRYMFKHTMLREAAYRMQIRSRRQVLHERAAEAIETLYGADLSLHFGELAYHAEEAQQIEKARQYLELAGRTAEDAYQNSAALDYYGRALKLTPDEDLEGRFSLLTARERIYSRIGDYQDQAQDLNEMWGIAKQQSDIRKQVMVLISQAWMWWWMSDYEKSLEVSRKASSLAASVGRSDLMAKADNASTWSLIQHEIYDEAQRLAEKSLVIARQSGDRILEVNTLHSLGFVYRVDGNYYAGLQAAEQALELNREGGDLIGEATSLSNLGAGYMTLGSYNEAKDSFLRALEISRDTGSKSKISSALINLAWNGQAQCEWDSAKIYGEEGLKILQSVNQIEGIAEGNIWMGHIWYGLGQLDNAFAAYEESLRLRRQLKQEYMAMEVLAGMGRTALAQNKAESALGYTNEILSYMEAGGSLDGTWEPLRIYLTCYQVLVESGDARASEILSAAYQKLQKWANLIPDAAIRGNYLEQVPWHREIAALYSKESH